MSEIVMHFIGGAILLGLVIWIYFDIPDEDPEIIAARKEYGKADI